MIVPDYRSDYLFPIAVRYFFESHHTYDQFMNKSANYQYSYTIRHYLSSSFTKFHYFHWNQFLNFRKKKNRQNLEFIRN